MVGLTPPLLYYSITSLNLQTLYHNSYEQSQWDFVDQLRGAVQFWWLNTILAVSE